MPAVTRIGDADVAHCSGMTRAAGSSNVFVNGIGVSRLVGAIIEAKYNNKRYSKFTTPPKSTRYFIDWLLPRVKAYVSR